MLWLRFVMEEAFVIVVTKMRDAKHR